MAKPRRSKALLKFLRPLQQDLITLSNIIYRELMSEHDRRVHLASLNPGKNDFPGSFKLRMAVTDELDASLHDGAEFEVVGVCYSH